jgi:hypothetical protein
MVVSDFQPVPGRGGDGGIDGLSHGLKRAYCCYGPEHDLFKKPRERTTAVINKFRKDLCKLYQLGVKGRGKTTTYAPLLTTSLDSVLPPGTQVQEIYLLVSWFESREIVGGLQTSLKEYQAASACRYFSRTASMVTWGPKQMASSWGADEGTLLRMDQARTAERVRAAAAQEPAPPTADFDQKFAWLKGAHPKLSSRIELLAKQLRDSWRVALAFERDLAVTAPTLHKILDEARSAAHQDALFVQAEDEEPGIACLRKLRTVFQNRVADTFRERYGPISVTVADGELGRRIGECFIDWRPENG